MLCRTWINVPNGPSAPPSPSLAHVIVCSHESPNSGTQSGGHVGGQDGTVLLLQGEGVHLQLLEQRHRGWGGRLDLVNGDRGAGAGGGPHPRTASELALRWQGGRRRGGSSSDGDEVARVTPDPSAAPAAMPGCWLRVGSRQRPPSSICARLRW
jgi:hypothetical protein